MPTTPPAPAAPAGATGPVAPNAVPVGPAAAFVLVWSSGYILGPASVAAAGPLSVLGYRFVLAAVLAGVLARWLRGPLRVTRPVLVRVAGVGLVMNAVQFGLMYLAFDAGLAPTLGALLHSLSPVLTVLLAGVLLEERVGLVQVVGFVLGVAGVLVVLGPDVEGAGGPLGLGLGVVATLALSLGTLGQRWLGGTERGLDPLWSLTLQLAVSAPPMLVLGLTLEGPWPVTDLSQAVVTVVLLAAVNSVLGLFLLGAVVRRGGAGASSSVFFLSPPVTAVMAWVAFGDVLGPRQLAGLLLASVGVAIALRGGLASRS
ncbi:DMT family transporter [Nocardioides sp. AX2bis]|uniref:DMT family transporter n=1 Tax=Nocardioides sp. AX2bis TaxID=2653157 RepID=UPI00135B1CC5|nr:DMT family transporter [Nocardioides sp. AX2bis]